MRLSPIVTLLGFGRAGLAILYNGLCFVEDGHCRVATVDEWRLPRFTMADFAIKWWLCPELYTSHPCLPGSDAKSLFQRGGLVHAVELGMQLAVDESAATLLESVQRCSLADAAVGPNMKHGAEQGANGKEYNLVVSVSPDLHTYHFQHKRPPRVPATVPSFKLTGYKHKTLRRLAETNDLQHHPRIYSSFEDDVNSSDSTPG
ncbi:hypothetical protein ACCO45_008579 [Purpureocillium lilacinum]|uniref:Uncharacterized protein n=1 Tax=Purpureocillium lilacinum TaxID=33203 RepID=A0ACC4DRC9_PURLI